MPSCRRWKLISHPQATNPFGGAFINSMCNIQLRPVTMDNTCFMKWQVRGTRCSYLGLTQPETSPDRLCA